MSLIGIAIFGLIVRVIAKLLLPGKDPGGIFVTALIGMAGALELDYASVGSSRE
jgi:uncharacterized membrane protein YeaQ/YmgE (transglycosylase-associated protein family)